MVPGPAALGGDVAQLDGPAQQPQHPRLDGPDDPARRHGVEREDVEIHPERERVLQGLEQLGPVVADLGVREGPVGRGWPGCPGSDASGVAVAKIVGQPVVVGPRHHHVDVVVPGDVAAVPDRAEQGAVGRRSRSGRDRGTSGRIRSAPRAGPTAVGRC